MREKKKQLNNRQVKQKFGFLYKGFKIDAYSWQIIIMYRKISMTFISIFLNGMGLIVQAMVVLILLFIFIIITMKKKPYISRQLNYLELVSLIACCISFYCGILFLSEKNEDDPSFQNNKDFYLSDSTKLAFFIIIVVSNLYFVICWIYYLGAQIRKSELIYDENVARAREREENILQCVDSLMKNINKIRSMLLAKTNFIDKKKFERLIFSINRQINKLNLNQTLKNQEVDSQNLRRGNNLHSVPIDRDSIQIPNQLANISHLNAEQMLDFGQNEVQIYTTEENFDSHRSFARQDTRRSKQSFRAKSLAQLPSKLQRIKQENQKQTQNQSNLGEGLKILDQQQELQEEEKKKNQADVTQTKFKIPSIEIQKIYNNQNPATNLEQFKLSIRENNTSPQLNFIEYKNKNDFLNTKVKTKEKEKQKQMYKKLRAINQFKKTIALVDTNSDNHKNKLRENLSDQDSQSKNDDKQSPSKLFQQAQVVNVINFEEQQNTKKKRQQQQQSRKNKKLRNAKSEIPKITTHAPPGYQKLRGNNNTKTQRKASQFQEIPVMSEIFKILTDNQDQDKK